MSPISFPRFRVCITSALVAIGLLISTTGYAENLTNSRSLVIDDDTSPQTVPAGTVWKLTGGGSSNVHARVCITRPGGTEKCV